MKKTLSFLLATTMLVACNPSNVEETTSTATEATEAAQSETERLNEWFEVKYEEQVSRSPIQMTFLGRNQDQGKIDDFSLEAQDEQVEWQKQSVEELKDTVEKQKIADKKKALRLTPAQELE